MLETASLPSLLNRSWGCWILNRTWWTREHDIGLALLCRHKVTAEKAADVLARSPSSIAYRAQKFKYDLPLDWKDLIRPVHIRSGPREVLQYPYIREVRGEHSDLIAVNALVYQGIPDHMRADICQEIMLALWQKEVSLDELKKSPSLVRKYVGHARTMNYEAGGHAISLDMPMLDGRHWYDVLPDPQTMEFA